MLLLDIKAAFDSVWHNALIYKLIMLKFPKPIVCIIKSFLNSRTFRVHIGSTTSDIFEIKAGCPQGSCLSPILYNIYTADIPHLEDSTLSISATSYQNYNCHLTNFQNIIKKWKIVVNSDKCQAIFFTRKRKNCYIPQTNIVVNNRPVEWENNVKYLGIILDKKLTFRDHISYIVNKSNILIRTLYPLLNRKSALNIENKMLIFKNIFQAVMLYASPVWADSANCHLKKLQIIFSTAILHQISNEDLVSIKINKITSNFNAKCYYSIYSHINELVS